MDKPPMPPDMAAQAQQNPNMGPGLAQAQSQNGKGPEEIAVSTVEKILMGLQNETMKPYVMKALASLKVGLGMVQQGQPKSGGMNPPGAAPPGGGGGGQIPTPPIPGQMPA